MRTIATFLIIALSCSGCLTIPTEPTVFPIDTEVSQNALRDILTSYVLARQPELSDEEVAAEVDRIMAEDGQELAQEIRRARAIESGLIAILDVINHYFYFKKRDAE